MPQTLSPRPSFRPAFRRGLPRALALDGWWLNLEAAPLPPPALPEPPRPLRATAPGRVQAGAVLALVALGDALFWHHAPGLSLALFAGAIFAAALLTTQPKRAPLIPALTLTLATLPVIDYVQALSLAFLALGLVAALALLHTPPGAGAERVARSAQALARHLPFGGLGAAHQGLRGLRALPLLQARGFWRNWAFPAGGTLVLIWLLSVANPVLAHSLARLFDVQIDLVQLALRTLFWAGLALMLLPLLAPPPATPAPLLPLPRLTADLPAGAVLRALVLFNLALGVQTGLDLAILTGGAALPEGMSHATYAHRGAYPLLATAMLAGAFALAARPHLGHHRAIRPLLVLWLVQNVALALSAALRLELYIGAFGLSYLRLYALIWIGLVACGLALTLWAVLRARSNRWLLARTTALGLATLYAASFVNFAALIACDGVRRPSPDYTYLCALPGTAAAELQALHRLTAFDPTIWGCPLAAPEISGWRDWGFRKARVAHNLAKLTQGNDVQ